MEIQAGKKYKCDCKGLTACISSWNPVYGVWEGIVSGDKGPAADVYWLKNGDRFVGVRSDFDLKSEIREPRTFYTNEYTNRRGETVLGCTYYTSEEAAHSRDSYESTKKTIKLVEVLD